MGFRAFKKNYPYHRMNFLKDISPTILPQKLKTVNFTASACASSQILSKPKRRNRRKGKGFGDVPRPSEFDLWRRMFIAERDLEDVECRYEEGWTDFNEVLSAIENLETATQNFYSKVGGAN